MSSTNTIMGKVIAKFRFHIINEPVLTSGEVSKECYVNDSYDLIGHSWFEGRGGIFDIIESY